jgi:hypothetical protein
MFSKVEEGRSNRIFFLTDMEVEKDDGDSFISFVNKNSDDSIWTTVIGKKSFSNFSHNFLGIGLDLTANVVERVSKTPGANYSNVRTTEGFKELMDKEFGYLVTPLAFNINLELKPNIPGNFQIVRGNKKFSVQK